MLGLALYEETLCSGCGLPPSVTSDPDNHVFKIENTTCPACRSWARFGRVQASQDDLAWQARGEHAAPASPHPSDGRHTKLRRLTKEEAAAERTVPSVLTPAAGGERARPRRSARRPSPKATAPST